MFAVAVGMVVSAEAEDQSAPAIPDTISKEAQDFLKTAAPVPDGNPKTIEEWKNLQDAIETQVLKNVAGLETKYDVRLEDKKLGGVKVLQLTPKSLMEVNKDKVLLFIHGGSFCFLSPRSTTGISVPSAHHAGLRVISVDYPLAPQNPFPAALDSCFTVYKELLKEYPAKNIGVFGDSAGGCLTLSLLLKAQDAGVAMPAAAGLISPWCDIGKTGDSYFTLEGADPIIHYEKNLRNEATAYAGKVTTQHPSVSPLYADFKKGFPPTLIQTGTRDLFLSNCVRLHRKMQAKGIDVELSVAEGMWHVFQTIPQPAIPEARVSFEEMAEFFRRRLGK